MLDKLRASGLPDVRSKPGGGYAPPVIQIFSVPSGFFLSMEQVEASKRGEPIIDASQCTPLLLEHEPDLPALETSAPVAIGFDAEPDQEPGDPTVVDFAAARFRKPDDGDHAA